MLSTDYRRCWQELIENLTSTGAFKFKQVKLPNASYGNAAYTILSACEIASNMARYDGIKFGLV